MDVADVVAEFAINGVAKLDGIISAAQLEGMRRVWPAVREDFDRRFGPEHMAPTADASYSGKGPRRHQITPLPFAPPFIGDAPTDDPTAPLTTILEHPAVHAFLEGALGADYCCSGWGCNTPWPGSAWQRWHVDGLGGESAPKRWISVHWVIEDATSHDAGPLEYLPATQHVPNLFAGLDGKAEGKPILGAIDRIISTPGTGAVSGDGPDVGRRWEDGHLGPLRQDGATRSGFRPVPMLMKLGQVWFRDNLVYHRGTANTGGEPRDLFHLYVHSASEPALSEIRRQGRDGRSTASQFLPRDVWNRLSAQARSVFRKVRVAEVGEVAAERDAAGGWPEEDALQLAARM